MTSQAHRRSVSRTRKTNWRRSIVKILSLVTAAVVLGVGVARPAYAVDTSPSALDGSQITPPNLGTIDEYVNHTGNLAVSSYQPMIGVSVFEGQGKLVSGQQLRGIGVASVDRPGPGDDAGIRSEHVRALHVASEVGVGAILVGVSLFFPPALFGIPLIRKMGSPKAYDVIVAVDAERIRTISELEDSLRNLKAGETIYLTIIRDGQRQQLRLLVPAIFRPQSLTSQPVLHE